MIDTSDFRNGLSFILDGELFQIIEFQHVKPGKGGAFVRTRLRNLKTGATIDKTFRAGEKMEQAILELQARKRAMADALFDADAGGPLELTEEDLAALFRPIDPQGANGN